MESTSCEISAYWVRGRVRGGVKTTKEITSTGHLYFFRFSRRGYKRLMRKGKRGQHPEEIILDQIRRALKAAEAKEIKAGKGVAL